MYIGLPFIRGWREQFQDEITFIRTKKKIAGYGEGLYLRQVKEEVVRTLHFWFTRADFAPWGLNEIARQHKVNRIIVFFYEFLYMLVGTTLSSVALISLLHLSHWSPLASWVKKKENDQYI